MSLFTKKTYVGLDIGHHTVRAAQVERTPSGWRVARTASMPTPSDTIRDGVVVDPTILGLAIKNLLKSAHISASGAAIAISGGTVVVRPIRLPKMAESALRKSIKFEASRYVPNSIEDSYIEFEIIGDVDDTNMDVVIAAAPRELVDSRVAACEHAGLEVEHVEVATFAAFRSIIEADHGRDWSDKTLGLVDIGAAVTNLGVVSKGAFSMTRAIPAGGQVLTDALKSYFKLSDEDAESGKAQLDVRGLLNEHSVAENPPLRILHTHIDDLVREVRRSINYWQSQQSEGAQAKHVDVIVLCGGGSNLPGLAEYFQHKLGIETHAIGVMENPRFLSATADPGAGRELAVAVGLAMGMASTTAVREAKAASAKPEKAKKEKPAKVAKAEKAPKPPKEPKPTKPPKPPKGRTFKVGVPAETAMPTPEAEAPAVETAEVAAFLPPIVAEPLVEEAVPVTAVEREVHAPLVVEEPATEVEPEVEAPIAAFGPEPEELIEIPTATATPTSDDVASKYGPELAALIGTLEDEPSVVITSHADDAAPESEPAVELTAKSDEDAAPVAEELEIAAPADEAFATPAAEPVHAEQPEAEPVMATEVEAPAQVVAEAPKAPVAEELPVLSQPASAPAASVERDALWGAADVLGAGPAPAKKSLFSHRPNSDSHAEANAGSDKKPLFSVGKKADAATQVKPEPATKPAAEKKPLFSIGKKAAEAKPEVAEKPAAEKKPLFSIGKKSEQTAEKPAAKNAEKAPKPEKAEKPSKAAKPPKATKQPKAAKQPKAQAEPGESSVKKAVSWLFGGPKQHVKPTGMLTPKLPPAADLPAGAVASRDPQIELLRGSSLEPVDATLMDSKPASPTPMPEPQVLADDSDAKSKPKKSASKKAESTDPSSDSAQEAA